MDTFRPFSESLIKKGFTVYPLTETQQTLVQSVPFATRGTTTALAIAYGFRRVDLQITNNVTSPHENLREVFSALNAIGYPPQESIERIDIQGSITIKTQGDFASTFVPHVVTDDFTRNASDVFGRQVNAVGVRLSSSERITDGPTGSPFLILIEPLFNDPSNTKLWIQLNYSSASGEQAIGFLEYLYDRLKNLILRIKHE